MVCSSASPRAALFQCKHRTGKLEHSTVRPRQRAFTLIGHLISHSSFQKATPRTVRDFASSPYKAEINCPFLGTVLKRKKTLTSAILFGRWAANAAPVQPRGRYPRHLDCGEPSPSPTSTLCMPNCSWDASWVTTEMGRKVPGQLGMAVSAQRTSARKNAGPRVPAGLLLPAPSRFQVAAPR